MESLCEIEWEVQEFMDAQRSKGNKTLWTALVESARRLNGAGCDGLLLSPVERFIEKRLMGIDTETLQDIWRETDNGILATEQGFAEPVKYEMVHDIGIDIYQHVVENICREAKKKRKHSSSLRKYRSNVRETPCRGNPG